MKRIYFLFFLCCMTTLATFAQEKKTYTLEDVIPGGNNYFNLVPENIPGLQWWGDVCVRADVENIRSIQLKDGKESILVTLEEINQAIEKGEKPYQLSHELKPLRSLMSASLPWSERKVIVFQQNSYWVEYDFGQKKITNISRLNEKATNLDFCKTNDKVAYTVGNGLFVTGKGEESHQINPSQTEEGVVYGQAVHRNEFGIYKGTFWSPKGNLLAFYRMDETMVTDYPQVNTTTRIATLEPDKYPMAGMTSHKVTVGVYNPATEKTVYLKAGDPTDRYFTNISWSPDEKSVYVIELNRDQNHAELVRYNAENGEKDAVLYVEKHPKYVEPQHILTFLPWDETKFLYQSQRDGYNHLYLMDTQLKAEPTSFRTETDGTCYEYTHVKQLTQGTWLVKNILGFNPKAKEIIIMSTEVSPLQSNAYAVNVKTGKRRLIGNKDGMHNVQLSASGKYVIDNYTSSTVPRNIDIVPTSGKGKNINLLTAANPMDAYNMPEITLGTIKAADGKTDLYYRLIKPVNYDPNKKYPAVIYVYGGPHAQMIHNVRNYGAGGWDIYMAQLGYVMLTVDSRGSDNRGLEFENCTFRQLGTEEMKDQVKGVEFLKSLGYVDENRIGVHGWSFGGFMTTNLMLTYNDIFKVGVAGGPVIDWGYYEVMYGERYMDSPLSNPEGYNKANLKLRAGDLKGRLMLIHGGEDPTCVPQHSYTFLRACIDAGTHPDFFIYPEDGHNMFGRDRVHLYEHITRYFEDHLK